MLKENQKIKLKINKSTLKHYSEKGYSFKSGETVEVDAKDLTDGSGMKVVVICDYCGEEFEKTFNKYKSQRKVVEKDACFKCFPLKQKEVVQKKYSKDCTLQVEEYREKAQRSVLQRYGVDNVMKNREVKKKVFDTMEKRHGYRYAQQSPEIREKTKKTLNQRYGVEHISQSSEGKRLYKKSLTHVNGVRVSKGQATLAKELGGALNIFIEGYYADIVLEDKGIIIEYDGSGHNLSVIMGKKTQEEFDKKEKLREKVFREKGWKVFRVVNSKDKQIDKQHIVEILDSLNKTNRYEIQ